MESVLAFILGVVIFVLGILLSIALHEIGHLVPAKAFGVRVPQYMIGFGPTLWSRRVGETQYGLKAIPLGGYISMIGMYPPAPADAKEGWWSRTFRKVIQDARSGAGGENDAGRNFYELSVWKRIVIMLGGPTMNLVLAFFLFAIVLSGIGTPQVTTSIGSVSPCVQPAQSSSTTCSASDPVGPAASAGLKVGDKILSVNGVQVGTWDAVVAQVQKSPGTSIPITVERDGQALTLNVTPAARETPRLDANGNPTKDASGNTVMDKVGFVGIGAATALVPEPLSNVPGAVWSQVTASVNMIVTLPQRVVQVAQSAFGSAPRDMNGPVSVVGVSRVAGDVATAQAPIQNKASAFLSLLGSLNIALFVFNLIPLLPLDGGHVLGALWELLKRAFAKISRRPRPRPVDMAKVVPVTLAVAVVLIGVSVLLIYADIVKPIVIN